MPPSCVNPGGPASILRLPTVPDIDRPIMLDAAAAEVLGRWQARPGEILSVVDSEGSCYRFRLTDAGDAPCGLVFRQLGRSVESRLVIDVYQALPEKERFELILQKLTELGAARLVPVESARSTTLSERDAVQAKSHRWPDVVLRAAKQCRRAMIPELFGVATFAEALELAAGAELKLLFYEGEGGWSLAEAIGRLRPERVALLIGPEGGFSADEVSAARNAGFLAVGIGPRILRTETAAIAGTTLLQGLLGDLC